MFFDRFLNYFRDITFNCWCNHQTSVKDMDLLRFNSNGVEVTNLHADATFDAGILVNMMDLTTFAADRINRAVARTDCTARTDRFLDLHPNQGAANFRRAAFFVNMCFIFMAEVFERTKHRRRRTLTQSTKTVA